MSEQLKIAVERAVRPVTAPLATKLRMREELLALITDIHADELPRGEAGALERTLRRFGSPEELAVELQQSLRWNERFESRLNCWVLRKRGEHPARLAVRIAVVMGVWISGLFAVVLLIRMLLGGTRPLPLTGLSAVVALLMLNTLVITWIGAHLADMARRSVRQAWREPRIWVGGIGAGLFVAMSGLVTLTVLSRGAVPHPAATATWCWIAAATVVLMTGVLQFVQREHHSAAEWESLDLDGKSAPGGA